MVCLICSIIERRIPAKVVYEDTYSVAFLDARPAAPGHTMLVPRAHTLRVEDLTPEQAQALFSSLYRILAPIREAVGADATTIGVNNGPGSGQEVQHVHIHIIPRHRGDGGSIVQSIGPGGRANPEEIGEKIKQAIKPTGG